MKPEGKAITFVVMPAKVLLQDEPTNVLKFQEAFAVACILVFKVSMGWPTRSTSRPHRPPAKAESCVKVIYGISLNL